MNFSSPKSSRRTRLLAVFSAFFLGNILLAMAAGTGLKVGDRVEVHGISNPAKGTIQQIGTGTTYDGCFLIHFDSQAKDAEGDWYCARGAKGAIFLLNDKDEVVRDAYDVPADTPAEKKPDNQKPADQKPAGNAAPANKPNGPDPHVQGVPAARKPTATPKQNKAKAGPPPMALVKTLIKALYEDNGDDSKIINVDLHTVQIGTPRKWVVNQDMGSGNQHTVVYPVHTVWTMRTYQQSGVIIAEVDGVHKFYINAFGVWQCGLDESRNTKPLRFIEAK